MRKKNNILSEVTQIKNYNDVRYPIIGENTSYKLKNNEAISHYFREAKEQGEH